MSRSRRFYDPRRIVFVIELRVLILETLHRIIDVFEVALDLSIRRDHRLACPFSDFNTALAPADGLIVCVDLRCKIGKLDLEIKNDTPLVVFDGNFRQLTNVNIFVNLSTVTGRKIL